MTGELQQVDRAVRDAESPQILLVLIGLPGSGKTTFAEALIKQNVLRLGTGNDAAATRNWLRASQDDAPSRRRQECEARVRNGLRQGYNVVVDRVGFDAVQRSHFVNIAEVHEPRPKIYAMYLEVDVPTLEARLALRTSHPTLADPATAMRVLADMRRQLSPPRPQDGEGFDRIFTLPESRQPFNGEWSSEAVDAILRLIEEEGSVETAPRKPVDSRPPTNHAQRGRGFQHHPRGYRSRTDYRDRGGVHVARGSGYRGGTGGSAGDGRLPAPYPIPGVSPPYVPHHAHPAPLHDRVGQGSRIVPPPRLAASQEPVP